MFKYKIKIHPLYFLLALYYIIIGKSISFISCLVAVILHELAHAYAGKKFGYEMTKITLMPYGAMIYGGERFNRKEGLVIALAGPFCNACLIVAIMALWWIVPVTYAFTSDFLRANFTLMLFNLLPCFPLDGSRIVLSVVNNKLKCLRVLKVIGAIFSVFLVVAGIVSFWYVPNITLISIGIFLMIGSIFASKKEEYSCIAGKFSFVKNYNKGVTARDVYISMNVNIYELLKHLNKEYLTTFIVLDDKGQEVCVIDENKLKELFEKYDHKMLLAELIAENKL